MCPTSSHPQGNDKVKVKVGDLHFGGKGAIHILSLTEFKSSIIYVKAKGSNAKLVNHKVIEASSFCLVPVLLSSVRKGYQLPF